MKQAHTIYPSEEAYKNRTEDQKARDLRNGSLIYSSPEGYRDGIHDKMTANQRRQILEQKLRDKRMKEEQEESVRIANSRYGSWDW